MKRNFITAIIASVMVVLAAGVLYIAMSVYATDQFTQVWTLTPTVIEKELKPEVLKKLLMMNSKEKLIQI